MLQQVPNSAELASIIVLSFMALDKSFALEPSMFVVDVPSFSDVDPP